MIIDCENIENLTEELYKNATEVDLFTIASAALATIYYREGMPLFKKVIEVNMKKAREANLKSDVY